MSPKGNSGGQSAKPVRLKNVAIRITSAESGRNLRANSEGRLVNTFWRTRGRSRDFWSASSRDVNVRLVYGKITILKVRTRTVRRTAIVLLQNNHPAWFEK